MDALVKIAKESQNEAISAIQTLCIQPDLGTHLFSCEQIDNTNYNAGVLHVILPKFNILQN